MRDTLAQFDMTISEATRRMKLPRASLYRVFEGKTSVSAELALKFVQLTGGTPEFYLRMQNDFDLWQARSRLSHEVTKLKLLSS